MENKNESVDKILKTEYSFKFDEIRKNMMLMSYYKYGKASINYPKNIDAIQSLEKRLKQYKETGNTEFLADIANFAMLEYMFPAHKNAYYKPTDSLESCGVVGMGHKEMERFKEDNNF